MKFIDEARIYVESGKGGPGCISFRREKFRPRGGPDGGDGGKGGDIVIEATSQLHTLLDFKYKRHFKAKNGEPGKGNDQHGKDAPDLVLRVPLGTVVRDAARGELVADLVKEGERVIVAKGGRGGKGNARFATPTRQAPRITSPPGEGEKKELLLQLKLLADIGLIGFPNAGKSTLISRVSRARPKIADYPFTTLHPHLGVVESPEGERITLADVPGLISGAHRGVGLGLRFLRHVERTRILLYVLDLSTTQEVDPVNQLEILRHELHSFDPALLKRPEVIALNKVDLPGAMERAASLRSWFEGKGIPAFSVSALTGAGVEGLLEHLFHRMKEITLLEERKGNELPEEHTPGLA